MATSPGEPRGAILELGLGPLVPVSLELAEGSIGFDAAKARAAQIGAAGEQSPEQLCTLAEIAIQNAHRDSWRPWRGLGELAYEAARAAHEALPEDQGYAYATVAAAVDLTEVLHGGLLEAGDIRLYARAKEVTEMALKISRQGGLGPNATGQLSMRLGTLLVDAYTANRAVHNYNLQFGEWVARAIDSGDPELILQTSKRTGEPDTEDQTPGGWPAPLDGLREAERLLRTGSELLTGELRGRALKALAQALEWQEWLGGEIDRDELLRIAHDALAEFDAEKLNERTALLAAIRRLGGEVEGEDLIERLEQGLARYVAESGERSAWSAIGQAASLLSGHDPERALRLLMRRRELVTAWTDEGLRQAHFENEVALFASAYAPDPPRVGDPADFDRALDTFRAAAAAAGTPEAARAAAASLLWVMRVSSEFDREASALELAPPLGELDATLWSEHEEAIRNLIASLARGEGVNRWRADDADGAGHFYMQAADAYRNVGITVQMVQCIRDLRDVADRATKDTLNLMTAWLSAGSLDYELAAPSAAPSAVCDLAARILAVQAPGGMPSVVVQLLLQVAKGRRFAALLASGTRDFAPGPAGAHLVELAAKAEADLPEDSELLRPAPFDDRLGDDELITAWINEYETGPSDTPADRLGNLQRAAERKLIAVLTPAEFEVPALLPQIKERLDERTALLQLFIGVVSDGRLASWQLLLTRELEQLAVGAGELPSGQVQAAWRGRSVTMPLDGMWVGALRRAVQADPGPLDVAPEAVPMLSSAYDRFCRVLENCREPLSAAGVNRLIVVPHGSSRFIPLHLAGHGGHPLADEWTVTYLLNLAQLTTDHVPAERRQGVGVFGLSYADQPRLPLLKDSAAEAAAIAAECGVAPVLDEAATEAAFRSALESCRYVHLRAHGRMYVDAPMFHTVFLHPSDQDDGRMRAFEVLPLDLTGLELVTLGACETALARIDVADNPRGLPAALLLAGAQAVIGTLWPVLALASTCFFAELYRRLMAGEADVRAAFAGAQLMTRRQFPQYRDWGAFYLVGGVAR